MEVDLFAGASVRDFDTARTWYERLLGRPPAFVPHPTEAVWELAEHRFLYILEDPERAGTAHHTIFVEDLDAVCAATAERGIEPAQRETYSNGVRKATFRDPDGNQIGFGGPPLEGDASATG